MGIKAEWTSPDTGLFQVDMAHHNLEAYNILTRAIHPAASKLACKIRKPHGHRRALCREDKYIVEDIGFTTVLQPGYDTDLNNEIIMFAQPDPTYRPPGNVGLFKRFTQPKQRFHVLYSKDDGTQYHKLQTWQYSPARTVMLAGGVRYWWLSSYPPAFRFEGAPPAPPQPWLWEHFGIPKPRGVIPPYYTWMPVHPFVQGYYKDLESWAGWVEVWT